MPPKNAMIRSPTTAYPRSCDGLRATSTPFRALMRAANRSMFVMLGTFIGVPSSQWGHELYKGDPAEEAQQHRDHESEAGSAFQGSNAKARQFDSVLHGGEDQRERPERHEVVRDAGDVRRAA